MLNKYIHPFIVSLYHNYIQHLKPKALTINDQLDMVVTKKLDHRIFELFRGWELLDYNKKPWNRMIL